MCVTADDSLATVSDCAAGRCQEAAPELAQNVHDAVEEIACGGAQEFAAVLPDDAQELAQNVQDPVEELARDGAQELAVALPDDAQEVVQDVVKEHAHDAMNLFFDVAVCIGKTEWLYR